MDKKWYIFEGGTYEGSRADMALLSEAEAEVVKRFFENRKCFYDEGYAGTYDMLQCGPFESREEAVKQFIEDGIRTDYIGRQFRLRYPKDLVGEFRDMCKYV